MKLSKRQLSLRINVDDVTIYLWEKNRVRPSLAQIPKIIEFLGYYPYEPAPEGLGEEIIAFRRRHGLSQKKLARLLGIDPSTIAHWERGKNQPTKRLLDKLLSIFVLFPSSDSRSEE